MTLAIFEGARGSRFVADKGFGEIVARISIRADAPIVACAREPKARPMLAKLGKKDQGTLYDCFQDRVRTGTCPTRCGGDCNAANRPGQSTHERRNDGVAYRWWPVGFWLPKWARGIDVQRDRVAAFCAEARREGFTVTQTYPGSLQETQHVGFRKAPAKVNWWVYVPVQQGTGGRRAREVIRLLHELHDPQTDVRYLIPRGHDLPTSINEHVTRAIKAFQRDHHQKADGIVGAHTIRALRAQKRRRDKRLKEQNR